MFYRLQRRQRCHAPAITAAGPGIALIPSKAVGDAVKGSLALAAVGMDVDKLGNPHSVSVSFGCGR